MFLAHCDMYGDAQFILTNGIATDTQLLRIQQRQAEKITEEHSTDLSQAAKQSFKDLFAAVGGSLSVTNSIEPFPASLLVSLRQFVMVNIRQATPFVSPASSRSGGDCIAVDCAWAPQCDETEYSILILPPPPLRLPFPPTITAVDGMSAVEDSVVGPAVIGDIITTADGAAVGGPVVRDVIVGVADITSAITAMVADIVVDRPNDVGWALNSFSTRPDNATVVAVDVSADLAEVVILGIATVAVASAAPVGDAAIEVPSVAAAAVGASVDVTPMPAVEDSVVGPGVIGDAVATADGAADGAAVCGPAVGDVGVAAVKDAFPAVGGPVVKNAVVDSANVVGSASDSLSTRPDSVAEVTVNASVDVAKVVVIGIATVIGAATVGDVGGASIHAIPIDVGYFSMVASTLDASKLDVSMPGKGTW